MGKGNAYIGLGSNLGRRAANLRAAMTELGTVENVNIVALSGIYETSPVQTQGGYFLNAVASIETTLKPLHLLKELLRIESALGRIRRHGGTDARNIDLDLLIYGDTVIGEKGLILPHPRMLSRRFVLEPLAELDPGLIIPPTGITASEAATRLVDSSPDQEVRRLGTLEEVSRHWADS